MGAMSKRVSLPLWSSVKAKPRSQAWMGTQSGRVLIIDGGGRTVNLALFNNGEYKTGATMELGVEAALDNVDKVMIGRGARALTLAERGELLTALVTDETYNYIVDGKRLSIDM
jgi:hypothetical protein